MHRPTYVISTSIARTIAALHVRHDVTHGERLQRPGPFILACTHIGHLEPAIVGSLLRRPVHWLAREEFFRNRALAVALRRVGCISIDRRGVPVTAVRESLRRLCDGAIIGIFPEGGRTHGDEQVIRGGAIKGGACLLAMRAGVPIVPVVIAGVEELQRVTAYLPGRRTTVRTIVGEPIPPAPAATRGDRRARRHAMTVELRQTFVRLHEELTAREAKHG